MAAIRLKSLFVTFAGFVINEASKQLDQDLTLTQSILLYFYQIFLHDREGFISIDRFNTLVKPLVDLVSIKLLFVEGSNNTINTTFFYDRLNLNLCFPDKLQLNY